jgi:uncharacterized protein involved in exopolysaccharide biosynthesis
MLVVWLAVVLVATLVTLVLPESFSSTARIKVERDHPDIPGLSEQPPASNLYDPYFIQTEIEIIQSEIILGKVVDVLNLNEVWGRRYYEGTRLKTSESLVFLRRRLDLRPVRNTTLIDIRVFSENPKEAADLANQIAQTYRLWRLDQSYELGRGGLRSLEERAKEQEAKISRLKNELAKLAEPAESAQLTEARKLAYRDKQQELEEMLDLRRRLILRMNLEAIDLHLPKSAQVMIIEQAVPAPKPMRPNVPLNIGLSILLGGLLGGLLAALVYWLQRRAWQRQAGVALPTSWRWLRTFLRVTIALVVGVAIGYNCAMPLNASSLLLMQLFVFFGGIAFAYVELAKPTSIAASTTNETDSQLKAPSPPP